MSKRLKNIFLVSLLLVYAHGLEEVLTGFQHMDSFVIFGARYLHTTPEAFYWIFHVIWWLSIPILYFLFKNSKLVLNLMILYGLVFIVELHHIIKGLLLGQYYPGMITALFYPLIGFVYWKQLIKDLRTIKR